MTIEILNDQVNDKHLDSIQFVSGQHSTQELHFPIVLKVMTDYETKEYYLKKFAEWGERWEEEQSGELVFGVDRNIYRNQELLAEEPNGEEKVWVVFRLSNSNTWPRVWENKIGDYKNWH